jgi:tetratricopeptide (TPR) repeat protein
VGFEDRNGEGSLTRAIHNLGNLYAGQGKLDKAEEMFERALEGYEKRFGSDHPRCCSLRRDIAALQDRVAA